MGRYIVGEVSKNWRNGQPVSRDPRLLSQLFEHLLAVNDERGYRLVDFALAQTMTGPDEMNETIIAVFERREAAMVEG